MLAKENLIQGKNVCLIQLQLFRSMPVTFSMLSRLKNVVNGDDWRETQPATVRDHL